MAGSLAFWVQFMSTQSAYYFVIDFQMGRPSAAAAVVIVAERTSIVK